MRAGSRPAFSNGEEIAVRAAMKPLPTLMKWCCARPTWRPASRLRPSSSARRGRRRGTGGRRGGVRCVRARPRREGEVRRDALEDFVGAWRVRGADPLVGALGRYLARSRGSWALEVDGRGSRRHADRSALRRPRPADREAPRPDPRAVRGPGSRSSGASRRRRSPRRSRPDQPAALGGGAVLSPLSRERLSARVHRLSGRRRGAAWSA